MPERKPVRYRRVVGPPLTITRPEPDPLLEASPRWRRVDDQPTPASAKKKED